MAVVSVRGVRGHARQRRTHSTGRPGRARADGDQRAAGRTAHGPGNAQRPSAGTHPEHGSPVHGRVPAAPTAGRTALISDRQTVAAAIYSDATASRAGTSLKK